MHMQIKTMTKCWEEEKGFTAVSVHEFFYFIVCVLNIFTTQILIHVNEQE